MRRNGRADHGPCPPGTGSGPAFDFCDAKVLLVVRRDEGSRARSFCSVSCAASGLQPSAIFAFPGLVIRHIAIDTMHSGDLGVFQDATGALFHRRLVWSKAPRNHGRFQLHGPGRRAAEAPPPPRDGTIGCVSWRRFRRHGPERRLPPRKSMTLQTRGLRGGRRRAGGWAGGWAGRRAGGLAGGSHSSVSLSTSSASSLGGPCRAEACRVLQYTDIAPPKKPARTARRRKGLQGCDLGRSQQPVSPAGRSQQPRRALQPLSPAAPGATCGGKCRVSRNLELSAPGESPVTPVAGRRSSTSGEQMQGRRVALSCRRPAPQMQGRRVALSCRRPAPL